MAEHLDVTEEFLKDALDAYLLKYGKCTVEIITWYFLNH